MEKGSACSKITTWFIYMINRKTLNTFQVLRAYILMCFFYYKIDVFFIIKQSQYTLLFAYKFRLVYLKYQKMMISLLE